MRQRAISFALTTILILAALCGAVRAQDSPPPQGGQINALGDVVCGSAASSCVLKAAPGNFYGVYAECSVACWLMVFNAIAAPIDGATTAGKASGNLVECVAVAANGQASITYPLYPVFFSTGITAVISSTTCATKTAATTGFIHGTFR